MKKSRFTFVTNSFSLDTEIYVEADNGKTVQFDNEELIKQANQVAAGVVRKKCMVCNLPIECQCGPRHLVDEILDLQQEIECLRHFGNKDCTAMADEHLKGLRG
jgi:hypothetical protein